ncbi:unnamed protein product [Danaus chrysippus]|uniref:Adenosine deaminase n=1 Tax=Danaus chrysippus TaxID=151541 RepID=A0A8J2W322_9NEOP|nr:unnamed protein product [Danaus chrysippus]
MNDVFKETFEYRKSILQKELNMMLGNDIVLSDNEEKANNIIMDLKRREIDYAFDNPQYFNFSKHFFEYKEEVKRSKLFKMIQRMPKGAVLHVHDTGILSPDYVLSLTYLDDLYVCFYENNVKFLFSLETPLSPCNTQWQLMKSARFSSGNVEEFDADLRKHFTIVIDDPHLIHRDINAVWSDFQQVFITTSGMLCYRPIWEQYFYDTLRALRDDNVMYLEFRSVLPSLYDLDGTVFDEIETVRSYKKVLDRFMADYPDFYGAKLIYAPLRNVDLKTVRHYLNVAKRIREEFPEFLAGFDLVGQEDLGAPTKDFMEILSDSMEEMDYFFHAGESNWYGTSSDENLADAIALNTKRIGHAFAIAKHPLLMEEIKKKDIAIEVNVVSNAVLKLVSDVRNHPLAIFLANNLPVVLSSDDPGIWEAEPLSHDFYVTFVGVASRHADLRLLKKLAINSLVYSTYHNKDKIVHEFEKRWTKYIDSVIRDEIQ